MFIILLEWFEVFFVSSIFNHMVITLIELLQKTGRIYKLSFFPYLWGAVVRLFLSLASKSYLLCVDFKIDQSKCLQKFESECQKF